MPAHEGLRQDQTVAGSPTSVYLSPMNGDRDDDLPIEQAVAGGSPQVVGTYAFYFAEDAAGERWEWSPEVERIHGYAPGTARPTTELVLSHKHPDDLAHVVTTLNDIRQTRRPFSTRHRIIDTQGQIHEVVVIGERIRDEAGNVVGTRGFYLDVSSNREQQDAQITTAVNDIMDRRTGIEHLCGMLMLIYRIDHNAAFGLLKWRSQETNTKLATFAAQLLHDIQELAYGEHLPERSVFDNLLMTAHWRVAE
ncbi:PAS and ANTAR domain-containing protein [Mycolicibacterium sp. J2]|uniref:PAS and ANTAR domain-containing protein n=1 Tax=Mycolicibacterium sp. J2 TaxID=2993511 RepID=UPI002B05DE7E|nr:PAS and ANTAR domain-containing protein [Mycolicibacterium sp. J2]